MIRALSRSDSIGDDEELRLPRVPGVLRRYWSRHPVFADSIIALLCLLITVLIALPVDDSPLSGALDPISRIVLPLCLLAVGCTALVWRRRRPLLSFTAIIALECAAILTLSPNVTVLLMVSCYSVAVYRSALVAWTAVGAGFLVLVTVTVTLLLIDFTPLEAGVSHILDYLVLGIISTLIGTNVGNRKRYLSAVIDRSRQLLVEREQHALLAAAAERAHIAREMHDIVSHSLTVIVALSEGAAATADPAQARSATLTAAETARGALTEMRAMLGVLRDHDSPLPLAPVGPRPPLETVRSAQRAGYPATLTVVGRAHTSPAVDHAIGRIVQEGLTNAMRHSPSATAIAVRLIHTDTDVTIEIENDGVMKAVDPGGWGLRGLTERVAHAEGRIDWSSENGRWMLRAVLPASRASPGRDGSSTPHIDPGEAEP